MVDRSLVAQTGWPFHVLASWSRSTSDQGPTNDRLSIDEVNGAENISMRASSWFSAAPSSLVSAIQVMAPKVLRPRPKRQRRDAGRFPCDAWNRDPILGRRSLPEFRAKRVGDRGQPGRAVVRFQGDDALIAERMGSGPNRCPCNFEKRLNDYS